MNISYILKNDFVKFILILFLAMFLAKGVAKIISYFLKKIAKMTKNTKDDEIVKKMENPLVLLIGLFVIYWGIPSVNFTSSISNLILKSVNTLIIIIITYLIILAIELIIEIWIGDIVKKTKSEIDDQLVNLLGRTINIVGWILSLLYILKIWQVDIMPLVGSLGIAGLAIAFAFQETLKNLFGGIALILDKNLAPGDIIQLSSGQSGRIREMTLRSTRIQTWDNKLIIIPNNVMANDIITNISKPDNSRRIDIEFGVSYGTDPEYVKAIIYEELLTINNVEYEDPAPRVLFTSMGDSALIFKAMYWVMDISNFLQAKEDGLIKIYERLNKEEIAIPFPQTDVWLHDTSKLKTTPYTKKKFKAKSIKTKQTIKTNKQETIKTQSTKVKNSKKKLTIDLKNKIKKKYLKLKTPKSKKTEV